MAKPLSVSKGSSRITKKSTTRPVPKVYHIQPSCFRELVQELTGNGFKPAAKHPPAACNGRLQKFAPPPLSPPSDLIPVCPVPIPFSPLMGFSPSPIDWTWANHTSASPISLAYRQLAESIVEQGPQAERRFQEENTAALPLLPTFCCQPKKNLRDSNSSSPGAMCYLQRSPSSSPMCGNLSPTTFGLGNPGSFAGFDLGSPGSFAGFDLGSPGSFAGFDLGTI